MPCQFPADCLYNIFEFLEKEKVTLHSCLLVNRLWSEVSVRILWKNNWNFGDFSSQTSNTLISCLPNESKNLLHENGIFASSKPPLFNYTSFCKILSVDEIHRMVERFLKNQQTFTSRNLNSNKDLVIQEIFKMFMKQTSLKKLSFNWTKIPNVTNFTQIPGARDCLTGLSKLSCRSNASSEFCYQLSQICHNIQSINISFGHEISNELENLIFSQNNLKCLSTSVETNGAQEWTSILPSLIRCSSTLIKLKITCAYSYNSSYFNELQNVTFSQLQILKFRGAYPNTRSLIKFLEINGKNLKEFYVTHCYHSVNLAIAKFCLNLKSLYTYFVDNDTLKLIFHSCEQLEKIKFLCGEHDFAEKQIFEIVAKHSPKNFHELELHNYRWEGLFSNLESFFISWKNRIPQKPLSFIIADTHCSDYQFDATTELMEKYKRLGTIKKFKIKNWERIKSYYEKLFQWNSLKYNTCA